MSTWHSSGRAVRWALVLAAVVLTAPLNVRGDDTALVLVTAEEYQQAVSQFESVEQALTASRERATSHPQGPKIEVAAPKLDGTTLTAPIAIEVRWLARTGASIDLASFRVIYKVGFLSKDLTEKVIAALKSAADGRFDSSGIYVPQADLPAGKHRLVIELADTLKRRTYTELIFEVGKD